MPRQDATAPRRAASSSQRREISVEVRVERSASRGQHREVSEERTRRVRCAPPRRPHRRHRSGASWEITVADIGIDDAYADKVFVIFQRRPARDRYPGTGIGLARAKEIVEFPGGRIGLVPGIGAGAGLRFTLPVRVSAPASPESSTTHPERRHRRKGPPIVAAEPRTINVLLVEDDPGDVLMTREAFDEYLHNRLDVVTDGAEALSYRRREPPFADVPRPDLILLDLNLPRRDSREVLLEVKADPSLQHVPVIVLTTSQAEEDVLRSYQLLRERGSATARVLISRGDASPAAS